MLQIAKARAVHLRRNTHTNSWRMNVGSAFSLPSRRRIDTLTSSLQSVLWWEGSGRFNPLLVLCVLLLMLVMIGGWTQSSGIAHAQGFAPSVNNTYISSVLIVDNVSQIANHDPDGDRFQAAQLFVDLAPEGDQIGVLKISGQQKPESQLSGYQPLTTTDAAGKSTLRSKLTAQVFGPVEGRGDPNYPAYITPALQQAGDMLNQHAPAGNRRYVIIMTDAVALSGDQNNCPSAPTFHKWFCAAQALEQQGISVVLMGFTKPGTEAELTPTKNFLEAHGGTVLQVYDNTDLASNLAQNYADLLTGTHSNMFFASIQGLPGTVTLDPQIRPQSATFVALGDPGVSLATLDQPGETSSVATRQTTDNSYYHSAPVGSDYALETVAAGVMGGTWKLAPGTVPPRSLLVIVASAAHFDLQSPGAANPESDVSIRYLPARGPIALRASITASDGTPLTGVPFTADPGSLAIPFKANALPGSAVTDIDALLPDPNNLGSVLQVGIGKPLASGIYLLKTFPVAARTELGPPLLNVPASTLLTQGTSIHISATGDSGLPGLNTTNTSLQIYAQPPQEASWQLIGNGQNSAADDFVPSQGCGVIYHFLAVQEVQGQLADGQYDYVTYNQQPYRSNLQQGIIGQANAPSSTYLEWWNSSIRWPVSITSTTCNPLGTPLSLTLQGKTGSTPRITLVNGKGYSTVNGSAVFTARNNTLTALQLSATLNGCPILSFADQTTTLQLQLTGPDVPVVEGGTWQTRMICPSVGTNAKRYWQATLLGFFLLSIFFSRSGNGLLGLFAKPYLGGTIKYKIASLALKDDDEDNYTEAPTYNEIFIPSRRHATTWYLDRCNDQAGIYYSLSTEESRLSVLKFMLKIIEGEPHILMEASQFVSGDMTPTLRFSDENNLSLEPCYCEDNSERVIIGQDIIEPDLRILP